MSKYDELCSAFKKSREDFGKNRDEIGNVQKGK